MDGHRHEASPQHAGRSAIERALIGLRRIARALLAAEAVALVLIGLLAAAVAAGVFDYLFVAPTGLRWVVWGAGVLGALVALRRLLLPTIHFRPSLSDLALRVERTPEAERRGLRGVLASGLEFARAPRPSSPTEAALSAQVVKDAMARFSPALAPAVLRPRRPVARLGGLVAVGVLVAGAWWARPTLVSIGAARVLTPWADASWPTRTALADATRPGAHDLGRPLALEADLTKTDRDPGQTRVWASYRLWIGDTPGPVRRVAMLWQGEQRNTAPTQGDPQAVEGERYAWLHTDLVGEATSVGEGSRPVEFEIEYWFQTADASTPRARVLVVEPPMVIGARLEVEPPAYVTGLPTGELPYLTGPLDLGAGIDERARAGPILEGSRVRLAITFNKALGGTYATEPGVLAGFGAPLAPFDPAASILGTTYTLDAVVAVPTIADGAAAGVIEVPVRVADRHGLRSERESMFRLVIAPDQNPSATVTEPPSDESVLATAVVDLIGEGLDDVGVASVALEVQRATPPQGSESRAVEPSGIARVLAETDPLSRPARQRTVSTRLDVSTQGVRVGDELWIIARASDVFALGDLRHDPARSTPRRLRIISETELIDQIRQDLAGVREAAIRLDDAQSRLLASVTASGPTGETARAQDGLSGTLQDQRRYVDRLDARLERNNLSDPTLRALVQDAAAALDSATRRSESAAGQLDQAIREREQDAPRPEADEQQTQDIRQEQQGVRDELQRLASMLDRGSDGWLVRRQIERLLEQQRALQGETASAGAATAGRPAESLTPQERTELERIAQRQLELAQQAQDTIDELSQRARDLAQADPGQASGLRTAAQTGRERQVPQNLSQAAEQVARNNTNTARQQQQEAIDALQEMLADIERGQQNRDQTLQRVLADLVASLDALITAQEGELGNLASAMAHQAEPDAGLGLDRTMIALHANTLGVIEQVRTGYPEFQSVVRLVSQAATAQADAVVALRSAPIAFDTARERETISLTRLREARAEAQRLQEQASQRENARKRQQLRAAYRQALEQQVALRTDASPYVGLELNRRQRAEVRVLGERQESLRVTLADLLTQTEALGEAAVFQLAHARLDRLLESAASALRDGRADAPALARQQQAADILRSLYEALDDTQQQQSPFESAGGGGAGQGGGGGQQEPPVIMPIFELRLLRGMQQQTLELTRDLDAQGRAADPNQVDDVAALQRLLAEQAGALVQRMQSQGPPTGPTSGPGERP